MATVKKVTKKTTRKSSSVRSSKKRPNKKSSEIQYETFKLSNDYPPLMTFKVTKQTVYWIIIMAFVIFFQLWIIKLQLEVAHVINVQQTETILTE